MWRSVAAICVGGSLGCLLRWYLGTWLNGQLTVMPLGTLTANLLGGYIVGIAVAFFALNTNISPEWKLLVITGFCGGLTTVFRLSPEGGPLLWGGRAVWGFSIA